MNPALDIVQQAYHAFGRQDIPALLALVADEVDWECVVPGSLPYSGKRRTRAEVADFFAAIPRVDAIHVFEPREFIDAGEQVVVLGWEKTTALDTNKMYETEWVHVFTVRNGRIVRWRGFFDTAARYAI
jgi:uncharacterized protein